MIDGIEITEQNRFSVFVSPRSGTGLAQLAGWLQHFQAAGIKAVIAQTPRGVALYRVGMVDVRAGHHQ